MELYLTGHDYRYAVEQTMFVLLPGEKPVYPQEDSGTADAVFSSLSRGGTWVTCRTVLRLGGVSAAGVSRVAAARLTTQVETNRLEQAIVKQSFFKAFRARTGQTPPWGALTGIRPARLASQALERGLTPAQTRRLFRTAYFVSPSRTDLALAAAQCGLAAKASLAPEDISLYIGIPFCPSRCAYCSFVSADVKRALKSVEPYLDALDREMAAAGDCLTQAGSRVRTVYIGGGTPTTLSPQQLHRLMTRLENTVDLSHCTEYTVEAGRPDTITAEKLAVLRAHGVTRVSVNPQTMEDHVLALMGRRHTAADTLRAYDLARASGIPIINMDLIAGLPGDSPDGFRRTVDAVLALAPENITVHTLALKKGARLMYETMSGDGPILPDGAAVAEMLDYAWSALAAAGQTPYYLYRQKYMSGSFENVGWCRPGTEGLYNICIMEELHTILALGGGGSTKLTNPCGGRIQRLTNPKYPFEYIRDIDRICAEKEALVPFQQAVLAQSAARQTAARKD